MTNLTQHITPWYLQNARDLPWRNTQDPYLIWVSEIILQQTRVNQGIGYYHRFLECFPDVQSLARASEDQLLHVWQGLGYYSRARNMLKAAKIVVKDCEGRFPDDLQGLLRLPGIGAYTASAIASFSYGLPHAVVDGNVFRVLSRFHGEHTPIDTTKGQKLYQRLAHEALGPDPALHNQAMMELGATICTPKAPLCNECPLNDGCAALSENEVLDLPIKSRKTATKDLYLAYLVDATALGITLRRRPSKGIWAGLHDLPWLESDTLNGLQSLIPHHASELTEESAIIHLLSHRRVRIFFIHTTDLPALERLERTPWDKVRELGFPKVTRQFLDTLQPETVAQG